MSFICEAQNNAHKLRLLTEAEEETEETPKRKSCKQKRPR
jgi:hypothetical protein